MTSPAHHDPDGLAAATVTAARLAGCNCHPDVELAEELHGVHRATIRHDGRCSLIQRLAAQWN